MAAKLFVGGLAWATTEDTLRNFFSQVGTVQTASIITDKFSGRSKGFGFVEMSSEEEAQRAISELNGKELDGRTLVVNEARPQAPREDRGGSRSFGGGGGGFQRGGRDDRRGGGGRDDRGGRNW